MTNENSSKDWRDEFDDLEGEMKRISALANNVGATFASSLANAISKGKGFKGIINQIGQSFKDLALKMAMKPLQGMMTGLVESLFSAFNPVGNGGGVKAFAKGGVIQRPTYFSHAGGLGLAGEAGPEAILPLRRDSSGQLGIASQGSSPVQISMTVNAKDAESFRRAEADLGATLLNAVKRGRRAS